MSEKSSLNIGSVGGNLEVGGDIVAGDKVAGDKITSTEETTTSSVNNGFKKQEDKAEFIRQIDELRSMMRLMKNEIEAIEDISEDSKDEIVLEIMEQVKALKTANEEADTMPIDQTPPKDRVKKVEECLDRATTFMEKLQKFGEKSINFSGKILPIVSEISAGLFNVRSLFGLP